MQPDFIHLRLHTEFALTDGLLRTKDVVKQAAHYSMPAIAITDPNNLFAAVKFYKAAIAAGIKPIIGADVWLENPHKTTQPYLITLLCQNNKGYKNLLELISNSYLTQLNNLPMLKRAWLKDHNEGLIVLSGAHQGDLGNALLRGVEHEIKRINNFWQTYFKDRYYIELRRTGKNEDSSYLNAAIEFARQNNLPIVATNDIRFAKKSDFDAHEARVCISNSEILSDPKRSRRYTDEQYFKSPEQMIELFSDLPEAIQNTVEIAKRCTVSLTLNKNFLPIFPVPEENTTEEFLINKAQAGLNLRPKRENIPAINYKKRLQKELEVINRMGFAGYFLIVADFTKWSRDNDVPVGPGRGSGSGSLVAYALGITDLDPLQHDLLFERFLNPERISLPDFDIDFCMAGRDRVIEYVMQTHGRESVAQIITYGTMAARAVLRDVGRVLGMPYGFIDRLAKLIPFEIGMTLDKALQQEVLLNSRYTEEEDVRTLIDLARKLEGLTRNVGRHAGGVVIAPSKLTNYTPLYCETGETQHPVTQFDKGDVEAVGLVKFDFLGLRTLTIIDRALKNIVTTTSKKIDITNLPTDDIDTYELLKSCRTTAVFQLESRGMKDLVKRLQPDCFEDIVALVALFRPGPLQSGMVDDFIDRKHGRAHVTYPHPKLEAVLKPTYGVIVYQEQVMKIAQVLAGYSLGAADILRSAMGKKKLDEMAVQREIFCKGAIERGVKSETATYIFDLMEKFAGYGFNKAHATAYALISYQTAWLKTHYKAAFMAAVLSSDMDHTDKVVQFIDECRAIKLAVSTPDVNFSDYNFRVIDENNLAWGLGSIKGLGEGVIAKITAARDQSGKFTSLTDFCQRVGNKNINKRSLEALIKSGAMDSIDKNRARLSQTLNQSLQLAAKNIFDKTMGQGNLFGMETTTPPPSKNNIPEWSEAIRLFNEKETLGLYLSGHPVNRYKKELANFTTSAINNVHPTANKTFTLAGIITRFRTVRTKRGDIMAVFGLEDGSGQLDAVCFSEIYNNNRDILLKDNLIVIQGEVKLDDFSGNLRLTATDIFSIQTARERFGKYLQISLPNTKSNKLTELAKLLNPFKGGKSPIKINYLHEKGSADLSLGESWNIQPKDELFEQLSEWLGIDSAQIIYQDN